MGRRDCRGSGLRGRNFVSRGAPDAERRGRAGSQPRRPEVEHGLFRLIKRLHSSPKIQKKFIFFEYRIGVLNLSRALGMILS